MPRVFVNAPGGSIDPIDLEPDKTLLIGREPDPSRIAHGIPSGTDPLRTAAIPISSISANHVVLEQEQGRLTVTDLGSKNGTWLKLPPNTAVHVRAVDSVSLQLALRDAAYVDDDQLEDADWRSAEEFPQAVARVLEAWLQRRRIPARVSLTRRTNPRRDPEHPGQIPLPVAADLHVLPLETMESTWPELLTRVWRYVTRQSELFQAEEQLRREGLVVASPSMRSLFRSVMEAAKRGIRLLIVGPTGAGKEALARHYHNSSGRNGAFVARNCGMLSKDFLRVELFGAERGSFTGSVQKITGAVERANGGTLFLDEIGELPLEVQPMLLRFLDRGEYERLGQFGASSSSDVRVVCATNRDLRSACAKGTFRTDLWFRLSIQVIEVPPLRDRPEDIEAYLRSYRLGAEASAFEALAPGALELVLGHRWEGNFRELGNFVERLPRALGCGALSADQCRRALEEGALVPLRATPKHIQASGPRWSELASRAASAFSEDHEGSAPQSWDDVKEYVEKYLKPLLFAHLSGVTERARQEIEVRLHADRLAADRATAQKQIERYFERFTES